MKNKRPNTTMGSEKVTGNLKKLIRVVILIGVGLGILALFFPERSLTTLKMSGRYGREMIAILPAVLIMMGLADVWIPKTMIKKYLGENSGLKGMLIAIFLGTLPTGPMYIAFPIAAELLHKKASITNVVIFLGVWASLKIPQIGVEIQFLGLKFAVLRFVLTLISVIAIGLITEYLSKGEVKYVQEN